MELIEIIIFVLKIFSLSSFILLSLSYFFFKLKDRARIKPYMLIEKDPAAYEAPVEKEPEDILNYKKLTRRFKVINEERIAKEVPAYYRMNHNINKPKMEIVPPSNSTANIYSLYSSTVKDTMYKLKFSGSVK